MAIGVPVSLGVQSGPANNQPSTTLTTIAAIPSGSLVVVGVIVPFGVSRTISSVSDGTNSYTQAVATTWNGTNGTVSAIWYKENASAVGTGASLTVTYSGNTSASASNPPVVCAAYVSGIVTSSSLDKFSATETNNGTAYASGTTGTLSQSAEIAFGFLGEYNANVTITDDAAFTNINSSAQGSLNWFNARLSYKTVSATTALNYQPSTSANTYGAAAIATFRGIVGPTATGVSGSGAAGTAKAEVDKTATGVFGTGTVGALVAQVGLSVIGAFGNGQVGSLVPQSSIAGVYGTGQVGSVTPAAAFSVSGIAATGFAGTVSALDGVLISGVEGVGIANEVFPIPPPPATRAPLLIPEQNGLPASLWLGNPNNGG